MGWVSPTSYSDPFGGWANEINAYDGNLGTYAGGSGGKYLRLSMGSDITTYKVRIYCSDPTGGDVSNVSIGYSAWTYWTGTIPALTWFEVEFDTLLSISGVNISSSSAWRLYEFQFWEGADGYQSPAPEDYIVDNESVIEYTLENPQQRKLVVGPDGRIHCVFRKYKFSINTWRVYYAYSDDYGKTWTVEDPTSAFLTTTQYTPSIAVDSTGAPHIVFSDYPDNPWGHVERGRYVRRSPDGTWTLSDFYVGSLVTNVGGEWKAGDKLEAETSGATRTIIFVFGSADWRYLCFTVTGIGLIHNERLINQTRLGTARYQYEIGPSASTAIVIDSNDRLRIVGEKHDRLWYWLQLSPNATIRHSQGFIDHGQNIVLDIDPSNLIKTVYIDGLSYYDGADDTLICTGTYPNAYLYACFSIASDSNGNVHFVLAQKGLGGNYSTKLNIKYYKRIGGSWSGPIHITDVDDVQRCPSISIDTQNRIHVMWQGKGWGTYTSRYSVLMRTYENGAWGATQVILNEDKDQGPYGASLLHAWHPSSNRLKEPIYIFARQGSWKIQFTGVLRVSAPDNLLCEQTKNPTNVSDPNPEFSAVYRYGWER